MKILHDLGHHAGQGLAMMTEKYGVDDTWRVYCWEPNPESFRKWMVPAPGTVNLPCAAWVVDGARSFQLERTERGTDDGWGSSMIEGWRGARVVKSAIVPTLRFSTFMLANSSPGDEVHIKMDIEGSEFPVLSDMLANYTPEHWGRIATLDVEFHERFMPGEVDVPGLRKKLEALTEVTIHP